MVQEVTGRDVWGSVGKGFARGLSEQVPKEIERSRLSSGLKQFEQDSAGLNPMQQLARISTIPGVTPQMIQSFGELAKQQARGQALDQQKGPATFPMPQAVPGAQPQGKESPSITQEEPLKQIQEGYIPPTQDEVIADAGRRYNENPALYGHDPQRAIDAAETSAIREQSRQEAFQKKHENLTKLQDNVVKRLGGHAKDLNVQVPANVYSTIEDKAIQATKPKKLDANGKNIGGEGLTEQQAMKKYGAELDDVSREYSKINEIGNWGITGRPAKETLRSLKALQEDFEKREDTENLAAKLISDNKFSPKMAYAVAQPVYRVPEASRYIKELPRLERSPFLGYNVDPTISVPKTMEIAPALAKMLKSNDKLSPLAVAYEIEKLGYDPQTWLQYVTDNQEDLNLRGNQGKQLKTPNNLMGTLNDWWLESWSGL